MLLVYNFGINLFCLIVRIASLRNQKAKRFLRGRKGQLKKIEKEVCGITELVWVHCASLGEFEQGRPLIEEIKLKYPQKKILLTFYSPSGYDVQKNYKGADFVYYLPFDTIRNSKRFIKAVTPEVVFFIKYEYWLNFLTVLNKKKIPVYFVSAIFRQDQLFFKNYGGWYRKMLKMVNHFFVQNQTSADLLESINIKNYTIAGDTRFDRVAHIVENVKPLKVVESFVDNKITIVVGSSWKSEEALVKQYLRNHPELKIIMVPHEVENGSVDNILNQYGELAIPYSKANINNVVNKQVLVVDCYGILTSLYQYAYIAIVGGGFGVGIHNILEPATFGMPVIFGPNYERFGEAVDLVGQNCAFPVNNIEEFNTVLNHLLKNYEITKKISQKTAAYVQSKVGATQLILNAVF